MLQFNNNSTKIYTDYLKVICSLSKLFSDSNIPYLHYRIAENIYCKVFDVENLAKLDIAYDAKMENYGIGIKTFRASSNLQKNAEFDKTNKEVLECRYNKDYLKLAQYISELRNERINFANRTYGIEHSLYHCIARKENQVVFYDTEYNFININNIKIEKITDSSMFFCTNDSEYSFNFSKSTLFKRFIVPNNATKIDIEIINEPFEAILECFRTQEKQIAQIVYPQICLPLYSVKNNERYVAERSGLNQWNASGRKRDFGEVYIQIPSYIHKNYSGFFPNRDIPFELELPTGEILTAKVCQDGGKALMTNPNKALSDWLLRKVFNLKEGELLTYKILKLFNVDSVLVTKINDRKFKIDFSVMNTYDNFINTI